jgi:hypothetical protein
MASVSALAATIVLVHGGFVDGSGWEGVHKLLKKDGFNVSVVQNPTTSLGELRKPVLLQRDRVDALFGAPLPRVCPEDMKKYRHPVAWLKTRAADAWLFEN